MAYWNSDDVNQPHKDSKTVKAALSAYETALFRKILEKKAVEKAQTQFANDSVALSSLFAIFH
ncbi:MAG: hypothetical protein HY052_01210 [Proteobacteria bacterium]|nr:hypothetical protein [Pseudomonadota bacterium]